MLSFQLEDIIIEAKFENVSNRQTNFAIREAISPYVCSVMTAMDAMDLGHQCLQ